MDTMDVRAFSEAFLNKNRIYSILRLSMRAGASQSPIDLVLAREQCFTIELSMQASTLETDLTMHFFHVACLVGVQ